MKLRYTRTARAEIAGIYSYLSERNPSAASAVLAAIEKTAARLEAFPLSSVATDMPSIRIAMTYPYPYLLFYSIDDEVVVVRNVRHAARTRPRDAGNRN